jgi:hypothetical protein
LLLLRGEAGFTAGGKTTRTNASTLRMHPRRLGGGYG